MAASEEAGTRPADPESGPAAPRANDEDASVDQRGWTIDELARRTGSTVRTIRSYQDRGLLPGPRIIGRTGYYDESHEVRLRIIGRLLEQRFSLAAIRTLFAAWEQGQSLGEILGFVDELTTPVKDERRGVMTQSDLARVFGAGRLDALDRAVALGLLEQAPPDDDPLAELPDDAEGGRPRRFAVPSPSLFDAGAKLVDAGVPIERLLDETEALQADAERIAARFVDLFRTYIWDPWVDAGRPPEQLRQVSEYLSLTRPLPIEAISSLLSLAMRRQLGEEVLDADIALTGDAGDPGHDGGGAADPRSGDGRGDGPPAPGHGATA